MSDATPQEGVVSAHSDAEGILIVRVFDAPRELVFKAWTEAERFATWFGEHGSSIPLDKVSMDARPGGAWSATMIYGPDRSSFRSPGRFLEVVEPERVVMTVTDSNDPDAELVGGTHRRLEGSRRRPDGDDVHATRREPAGRRVLARDARLVDLLRPDGRASRGEPEGQARHRRHDDCREGSRSFRTSPSGPMPCAPIGRWARNASAIVRAASPYDSRSVLITRWYRSGSSISAA